MGSSTLAEVGGEQVTEQEMSEAMQRRLQQVRQQKPEADYATIIGDFEPMLDELIDQKTLLAFAEKFDFPLSKRLVDAEIAQIPQTKGLNGKFSEQAYQQLPRPAAADRQRGPRRSSPAGCSSATCSLRSRRTRACRSGWRRPMHR